MISAKTQQRALKRLLREKHRVTIKDAFNEIDTRDKELLIKQRHSTDCKIDNILRLSDITECNKILKEIK